MPETFQNSTHGLLLQIMHLEGSIMHRLTDNIDIHPGQFHLLIMLKQKDGISQKDLANSSCVSAPTITVMLKNMGKKDLIYKQKDKNDRRIVRIYLTEKSKKILKKTHAIQNKMGNESLRNISAEEQLLLNRLLQQIRNNLLELKDTTSKQLKIEEIEDPIC